MPEPTTEPKVPLYDLRLDREIDTLLGHAFDLQPGGYYRFQLPEGNWQGHLDNIRACLPKGVVLRPESPPHKGEQLYFYRRGMADDLNGITSAQTPKSLRKLLPGLRLPSWLRRFIRERKVAAEARKAAREARIRADGQAVKATLEGVVRKLTALKGVGCLESLYTCTVTHRETGEVKSIYCYIVGPDGAFYKVSAYPKEGYAIEKV